MKTKEQLWDDIMSSLEYDVFHIQYHSNPKLIEMLIEEERERQIAWYITNRDFVLSEPLLNEDDFLVSIIQNGEKINMEEAIEKRLDNN